MALAVVSNARAATAVGVRKSMAKQLYRYETRAEIEMNQRSQCKDRQE